MGKRGNPNWVKGCKSPNPGGEHHERKELRAIILEKTGGGLYFVNKLIDFIENAKEPRVKLDALKIMIEYGYGKPRQQIEIEGSENPFRVVICTGVPESAKLTDGHDH